jgi:hypothetical protein
MMSAVYFIPDPFFQDSRVRLGYLVDGHFSGSVIPLSTWSQLTQEQQALVRLVVGAMRGGANPRTISPQVVVEGKSQEAGHG